MKIVIYDESRMMFINLSTRMKHYYDKQGIGTDFISIDSEAAFKRFLDKSKYEVDLFVLPTKSKYSYSADKWMETADDLLEDKRIKHLLLLFGEGEIQDAVDYEQSYRNVSLYHRSKSLKGEGLEDCLSTIKER